MEAYLFHRNSLKKRKKRLALIHKQHRPRPNGVAPHDLHSCYQSSYQWIYAPTGLPTRLNAIINLCGSTICDMRYLKDSQLGFISSHLPRLRHASAAARPRCASTIWDDFFKSRWIIFKSQSVGPSVSPSMASERFGLLLGVTYKALFTEGYGKHA